jgi:inactivated superfamily I helicase
MHRRPAKRRQIWEEKKGLANAMYEQRLLGLKRLVMATWLAKIEKKKRVEQARDRQRLLKERKAHKMSVDLTPS